MEQDGGNMRFVPESIMRSSAAPRKTFRERR